MEPVTVYAICVATALGLLSALRIARGVQILAETSYMSMRKHLLYPLVVQRANGSTSFVPLDGIFLAIYIAANAVVLALRTRSREELSSKSSMLGAVGLVLLFLGGRTSLVAETILGIEKAQSDLMHRWIGRVCVVQGTIHGFICLLTRRKSRMGIPVSPTAFVRNHG